MNGVFLVDKPAGMTSYEVLRCMKRTLGLSKVGHAGTLDPFATGLLIVLVGEATGMQPYFLHQNKTYTATFVLGKETDTLDLTGQVHRKMPYDRGLSKEGIQAVIDREFLGEIKQVPPRYSAIKVKGKRAYQMAREGLDFVLPARRVWVHSFGVRRYHAETGHVEVMLSCSAGTYVRSLARDLGRALGTVGLVSVLRREAIGVHDVKKALGLQAVQRDAFIPIEEMFSNGKLKKDLTLGHIKAFLHGDFSCLEKEVSVDIGAYVLCFFEGKLVCVLKCHKPRRFRMTVNLLRQCNKISEIKNQRRVRDGV